MSNANTASPSHPYAYLSAADPEWVQFSSAAPIPRLLGSAAEMREMIEQAKKITPVVAPVGLTISEKEIKVDDGTTITLRIYTPEERRDVFPLLVYYHGGGWTIGDLDSEDGACRSLCTETTSVVVGVNYRKAPENPFPIPVEDSWNALCWVAQNAKVLNGDPNCLLVGGTSAGANITAVLTQRARDLGTIKIQGQILRIPFVCHPDAHPADLDLFSYEQNADAPILPKEAVYNFLKFYNPPPNDIRTSPLLAKRFSGLPPAYLQISGLDPLRDEGLEYARRLELAGTPVKTDTYPGLPHGFMMFPQLQSTQKCTRELIEGVRWLINSRSSLPE